jgi:hypothetical protein
VYAASDAGNAIELARGAFLIRTRARTISSPRRAYAHAPNTLLAHLFETVRTVAATRMQHAAAAAGAASDATPDHTLLVLVPVGRRTDTDSLAAYAAAWQGAGPSGAHASAAATVNSNANGPSDPVWVPGGFASRLLIGTAPSHRDGIGAGNVGGGGGGRIAGEGGSDYYKGPQLCLMLDNAGACFLVYSMGLFIWGRQFVCAAACMYTMERSACSVRVAALHPSQPLTHVARDASAQVVARMGLTRALNLLQ